MLNFHSHTLGGKQVKSALKEKEKSTDSRLQFAVLIAGETFMNENKFAAVLGFKRKLSQLRNITQRS